MGARLKSWLIGGLLLGTAVYAIAEEVVRTTTLEAYNSSLNY